VQPGPRSQLRRLELELAKPCWAPVSEPGVLSEALLRAELLVSRSLRPAALSSGVELDAAVLVSQSLLLVWRLKALAWARTLRVWLVRLYATVRGPRAEFL
jgi:hypothetical protein